MKRDLLRLKSVKLRELAKKIDLIEKKNSNLENAQNVYFPTFSDSIGLFQIFRLFKFKVNHYNFYLKIMKNTLSGIFFSCSKIYKNKKKFHFTLKLNVITFEIDKNQKVRTYNLLDLIKWKYLKFNGTQAILLKPKKSYLKLLIELI